MSLTVMKFDSAFVIKKLTPFPLFLKHIGSSLIERGNLDNWYENRFIFDVYTDLGFVKRFEDLLRKASSEIKIDEIYLDLKANDNDYDLKVFDIFAEIRFVIWAHQNGFIDIHKIPRTKAKTPDFIMEDEQGKKIITEVKHIRSGNPFHDIANDRAKGLLLINGYLTKIGLEIDETVKYLKYQHKILAIRYIYYKLLPKLREQLSFDKITELATGNINEIDLLNNLLKVKATENAGYSITGMGMPDKPPKPSDTMKRLFREIEIKREQINQHVRTLTGGGGENEINEAIIFVSGISNEERNWWLLSEELTNPGTELWDLINGKYPNDSPLPIRIISNFGTTHDKYHDFPRNNSEYVPIHDEYKETIKSNSSK